MTEEELARIEERASGTYRETGDNTALQRLTDVRDLAAELRRCWAEMAADDARLVTDHALLQERDRLLALFDCPVHGRCVPYAIEQVERMRAEIESLKKWQGSAPRPYEDPVWALSALTPEV